MSIFSITIELLKTDIGVRMSGIVRANEWDVASRLAQLDLTKSQLIEIVKACVAGHAGCTDNDPPNAKGYESWRWGVRRARELLRQEGWEKDDSGNFSTIVNHKRKIRIAIMNSDDGAGLVDRIPQNRAKKGPNSEKVATTNGQLLLIGSNDWPVPTLSEQTNFDEYSTWHLCVHINGDVVRAELSLLNNFSCGYFTDYLEKIIVLGSGDWDKLDFVGDSDDYGPELDIEIARK